MAPMDNDKRRNGNRIYKHDQIKVCCQGMENEEDASIAQVMDLSEGGMNFITAVAFPEGEKLKISNHDKEYCARVLECRKCINGYAIRAEFNKN